MALELIEREDPEIVFVASADMYELVDESGAVMTDDYTEVWAEGLRGYLERMTDVAGRVIVLADTPRLDYDPAECLATNAGIEGCEVEREHMVDAAYQELEAVAAAQAGAGLISATDWLCFEEDCPLVRGPYLVYRDRHHLTATFAARLSARLGAAIDAVIGSDGPPD
jgi:hypothetical protein